jgi:Flp pilus assembly protein TadG
VRRLVSKFREADNGVAMVWLATTLVLLLGTAGFAVDLGWLYLNTSRTQRSVDAAAMAGVVNLPGFPVTADLEARDAARANGYDVCDPLQTGCADTLTSTPLTESMLEVTLSTTVNSFFLAVMGFDNFKITRTATAEYVKTVPMGSPTRCFGRDPTGTYCTDDPNSFWAAVSAPYTLRENGDPYSTHCFTPSNSVNTCNTWNTDYARSGSYPGYYYAVEVGSGASNLTVKVYDPSHYERSSLNEETGDKRYSPGTSSGEPGVTTRYRFYNVDSTPSDPTDNPLVPGCDYTLAPDDFPGLENNWGTLCTIGGSLTPGIYVFHVESEGIGAGSNQFSIAATTGSGPQPRVYGINDMSIWSNDLSSGGTDLYLVEIEEIHAGSKLELQLFDPGDAQGNSWMSVRKPNGSGGFVTPNCDWTSEDYWGAQTGSGSGTCSWQTTDTSLPDRRVFNNQWITAIIDIPSDYTCNSGFDGCFWLMDLDLSSPNERTVWRARVIGNPVRLVP